MVRSAGPVSQTLSAGCGMAMAATTGFGTHGAIAGIALLAAGAVLVGVRWPAVSTVAVLLVVIAIALAGPPTASAAVAGLAALGYLVLRHVGTVTVPTALFALGFTVTGLVVTAFPWSLPWLPLTAPFAAFGLYIVAAQPFLSSEQ